MVFPFGSLYFNISLWGGGCFCLFPFKWDDFIFSNSLLSLEPRHIESECQIKTSDDNEIYSGTFSQIRVMGLFVLVVKRMRICLLIDRELWLQLQDTINYANSL